ncbi:immobilization antigen (macronuclear) [Tetrahymena thermophila SB210]|uniref:Immobilization antigen n=1 Tax=Tetrahymena thermophila (strain SB210) TaxID=312017 RepID=Q22PF0_TETTS|nr:immobilization antigen [Tetrahymena thermophila SB210]EAR87159.1 immobilization antigen [Tetrahymena thermophila SB210]|eukprot:XP_001007404.1 immobilization antigen [Tetrahymena thermophila SB210]
MNILLVFIVLLSISANAQQCASYAEGVAGSCICIQGYFGTNAENDGACNLCPIGSYTAPPSFDVGGNTNSKADLSVCNICYNGYYMIAAATPAQDNMPAISALCNICPPGTGNNGVSTVGDISQCNICLDNYYQIANAIPASQTVVAAAVSCKACPKGTISPINSQSSNSCKQNPTTGSKILFASLTILIFLILA